MATCHHCGRPFDSDDEVVIARDREEVTHQTSSGREYIDVGARRPYHATEWPGDSAYRREVQRGRWGDLNRGG
jgi:hypothetical protein